MRGGALWLAAGTASVILHAGLALGLAASLAPREPPEQEPPAARLDLATYRVERSEARAEEARGEAAREEAAEGTALTGGAVPVGQAEAVAPEALPAPEISDSEPVPARVPDALRAEVVAGGGVPVPASEPGGAVVPAVLPSGASARPAEFSQSPMPEVEAAPDTLVAAAFRPDWAAAARPEPLAVVAAPPPGERQGAVPPAADSARESRPAAPQVPEAPAPAVAAVPAAPPAKEAMQAPAPFAVVQEAKPPSAVAEQASTDATEALAAPAPAKKVPEARPPAEAAAALVPPAETATAALAWSGGAGAEIDPVSLAAIQSFMQAGDLSDEAADPVRDGIDGLLESVPCARLQTVFDPETGALELRGHIPEDGLREPVLAALRAQVGDAIPVADNVLILPRPQCGALAGVAGAGLPQSEAQSSNPRVVGANAHARVYAFTEGDRLQFELQGPDYPAFFYIDYFDADGMVLHLQPNEYVPLGRIGVKQTLRIGAADAEGPSLDIRVAPPFGHEIMVAFAASEPLFDDLRPIREPAGPYLDVLKRAVAAARARDPAFKGEWVYFFVETRGG